MSRSVIWLLALLSLALLCTLCATITMPRIQEELFSEARERFMNAGLADDVTLHIDGRTAYISAANDSLEARAAEIVSGIYGVRSVELPRAEAAVMREAFALRVQDDGSIALFGTVPDASTRERLLAAARQSFPDAEIRDGLAVDSQTVADWTDDVAAVLPSLRALRSPGLAVTGDGALAVSGSVDAAGADESVIRQIREAVAPREVTGDIALATPGAPDPAPTTPEEPTGSEPATRETRSREPVPPPARSADRMEIQTALPSDPRAQALARDLRQRLVGTATFRRGTDRLTPGSAEVLRRIAPSLIAYPSVIIELQAHSDPGEGSRSTTQSLSEARARAAKRVLTEAGVPFEQIRAAGYGFHQPLSRVQTEEARARNRRVVIKLLRRQ